MSEKSLTLLELHLGDGDVNIGPFGITSGVDEGDAAPAVERQDDADVDEPEESDGSSRCTAKAVGGLLLALGALAVVAVAAAKLLGGDDGVDLEA